MAVFKSNSTNDDIIKLLKSKGVNPAWVMMGANIEFGPGQPILNAVVRIPLTREDIGAIGND